MPISCTTIRQHRRQGSVYVVVLMSSLIVATMGLSSLQIMRLQSRTASNTNDFVEARIYARAALDLGMLKIRNDPFWRTNLGNGNWVTGASIGNGTYTLSAVDPIDGNVTLGDNHPVILTGIGMKGSAHFKTSVRMEVGPSTNSCLAVSMHSMDDLTVDAAILTSDQKISSNHKIDGKGGATVNADVEAFDSITGSTYTKSQVLIHTARIMPDPLHALDYYLANGSTIPYSALPQWGETELITNPSFETNTDGWYASTNCQLQKHSGVAKDGTYSLLVKSRQTASDVAALDLPVGTLRSGNKYALSIPVFPSDIMTGKGRLTLTSTGDGVQVFETPVFDLKKNGAGAFTWVDLKADITPTWTGTLTKATVSIWISDKKDFWMDKVSLIDITYDKNAYVIDSRLISPTVNPYGALNAQGIYIIQCGGKDVIIGRSRIVGTLVFVDPGGNSAIQDFVMWEPAVYNFPALLTNDDLIIKLSSAGLSEAGLGFNFNPAGTPYPFVGGIDNELLTETYPSRISGLIYSTKDLKFYANTNITGVVIAQEKIEVKDSSLTLSYGNTYLNNPPPGFDFGTVTMKVVPGTWKRVVD